jgi:hypothetical protein
MAPRNTDVPRDGKYEGAQISPGNIAYPSLSELVEPCRSTVMSVRCTLVDDLL